MGPDIDALFLDVLPWGRIPNPFRAQFEFERNSADQSGDVARIRISDLSGDMQAGGSERPGPFAGEGYRPAFDQSVSSNGCGGC